MHAYGRMYEYVITHVGICICIDTYIHTQTDTHIYIYMQKGGKVHTYRNRKTDTYSYIKKDISRLLVNIT